MRGKRKKKRSTLMFPFGSCAGISGRFGLAVQQRRLVSLIRTGQSIWKKKWWSKSQSRLVFIWTKKKKKERDSRSCYFQRWAQLVAMCKIKKLFSFKTKLFSYSNSSEKRRFDIVHSFLSFLQTLDVFLLCNFDVDDVVDLFYFFLFFCSAGR